MKTTADSKRKLPPPLRYSIDELANIWGVSTSYVWQQIEAGRLRAVARDRQAKWRAVDPSMGQELDFGSKGLCGGSVVVRTESDGLTHVVHSERIEWDAKNVRVLHKDKAEFEGNSVRDVAVNLRAETTYLNIIGALLELMLGKSPAGRPQSVFDRQSAIIEVLLAHYEGKPGMSQRTLEDKFAAAKRSLAAT